MNLDELKPMKNGNLDVYRVACTAFTQAQLFQMAFIGGILYKSGQLFESNMIAVGTEKGLCLSPSLLKSLLLSLQT